MVGRSCAALLLQLCGCHSLAGTLQPVSMMPRPCSPVSRLSTLLPPLHASV